MPEHRLVGTTYEPPQRRGKAFDARSISKRLKCPESGCPGMLELRRAPWGVIWGCEFYETTRCRGAVGCRAPGLEPKGIPVPWATRQRRIEAHGVFDLVWKTPTNWRDASGNPADLVMTRSKAYLWLRLYFAETVPGWDTRKEVHIGEADYDLCTEIMVAIWVNFPELFQDPEDT